MKLDRLHTLILTSLVICLFIIFNRGCLNYFFAGDGFNNFQWLRNFATGNGTYEGPSDGYLFANHSYLTLFLLSPLIRLFPHPFVLFNVSFFYISCSLFLTFYIANWFLPKKAFGHLGFALTLAYLLHPLSLDGLTGYQWMGFEPETILPLLVLLLTIFFLQKKKKMFFVVAGFLLLTKEEYIPVSAVLYAWLLFLLYQIRGRVKIKWLDILILTSLFALCTWGSIHSLLHYKAINLRTIVNRNASLSSLLDWPNLWNGHFFDIKLFLTFLYTAVVPLCLGLFFLFCRQWKALGFLLLSLFLFVFCRLATDRLIYNLQIYSTVTPGLGWSNWARAIIPPMMGLASIFSIRLANKKIFSQRVTFVLGILFVILSILLNLQKPPTLYYFAINERKFDSVGTELDEKNKKPEPFDIESEWNQRRHIVSLIKDEQPETTILIPNSNWENFVFRMTMAQYNAYCVEWVEEVFVANYFKLWLQQAKYVVLLKSRVNQVILGAVKNFDQVGETTDYILMKKNEQREPLLKLKLKYW